MARLIVHPEAKVEMREAARWYEERRPGLGRDFLQRVRAGTRAVVANPLLRGAFEPPFRRYLMPKFPYAIIYAHRDDVVYVLAVMHTKRRPGYWRDRWDQYDEAD